MAIDKGIGFNRKVLLPWLDATAAHCIELDEEEAVRQAIEPIVAHDVSSPTNLRKTVAILLNIWHYPAVADPGLYNTALQLFQETEFIDDRIWLHYGMTSLAYPFFFDTNAVIGQQSRYGDPITSAQVRKQLTAEMGQLGSLQEAASRIFLSMREWGILQPADKRNTYTANRHAFTASRIDLETWLLAIILKRIPNEEIPFADLIRLPALYPFQLTVQLDHIRHSPWFEVQRQGLGLNMVRLDKESPDIHYLS